MQSLVQIGLEMWICMRYKQTNKQTNIELCIQVYLEVSYQNDVTQDGKFS